MGGWHRGGSQEYTFTAMTGADVLSGSDDNLNNGDSFTMGFGATACITVTDNDSSLSGDARRNEQGDDRRGQTADIEVNGISVHGDAKIYAEQAYVLHDQDGNCYFMVEIEVAGAANTDLDDFYAFIGDAPPAGAVLTVVGQHNVVGNWVKYRDLSAGLKWDLDENGKVTIEAEDMALSNYRIDDVDAASGGEVIKLKRGEGEASVIFGAESGNYDMEVAYVDENDGQGSIEVLVNGVIVQTIALDQDNNGSGYDNSTISTVVIEGLNLNQGDAVVLRGTRDGNEFARIDSITFCEANHAPIAGDDSDSVVEGGTLTLNLLANDTDEDGDTLTVTDAGGEVAGTPFGVMTDGGRNVQVTVTGTGVLTFVAAAVIFDSLAVGQTDSFTFNYTISDGNGEGDTAAVTVTIVGENDGPAVSGAITASASEDDAAFSVDLLDGASDIDNGAVLTVQNLVLTSGVDAGVTINGNSIDIDPNAYNSLAVNASEILTYSYDVVDEHGALVSQTATITIDGVNDLTDGDELNEGALASAGTVSQQLLDALTAAEAELVRLEVARQILIDKGDFSQPVAAQFALFFARADRAIEDAEADIAAAAVPVDLTNVLANTDDPEPGAPFVLRVDGAATSVGAAVAGDNGGLFTIGADGAATFSATGEFSALAIGDSAVTSITYTVGDVDGGEDQSTITVTVNGVNDAPVAAPLAVSGDEDTAISGQLIAVDPDVGDVLTYSLQSQSLIGTTTVNSDGTFTWNPGNNGSNFNGDVTFEYRVIDGNGGTDTETVTVTVNAVNDLTDGDEPNEEALATAGFVSQQLLDALTAAEAELVRLEEARQTLIDKGDFSQPIAAQFELFFALAERAIEEAEADIVAAPIPVSLTNVLDNTDDPEPGAPFVARVDGAAASIGTPVAGDNGGLFTIGADGAAAFSANAEFNALGLGDSATTSISYTIGDVDGGEDQSTITVTVEGVNDAPIITFEPGNDAGTVVEDDATNTVSGQLIATDVDNGATADWSVLGKAIKGEVALGSLSIDTTGKWTFTLDNDVAALADLDTGETVAQTFIVGVSDGLGGTDTQIVRITVEGNSDRIAPIELSEVELDTDQRGFVINGVSAYDYSSTSVSSAGDVNGDGFDDLIVGAFTDSPNGAYSGASFVVFGKADGTTVELSDVEISVGGFVINGVSAGDLSGSSVSSAGDVNGDGFDDLIVGAYGDDPNGSYSGASFVVFGKADSTAVELSAVAVGTGGFGINGVSANDQSGNSVSSAGDVNGDGFDDLIVGARFDSPNGSNSGASFVVFGKADGTAVELSGVEAGTGGFVINGVSTGDRSGDPVSSAGDVNGDGFDDLIVGARFDSPNGSNSGASFVVFGKTDGTAVELSAVEAGSGGFVINGVSTYDNSGNSVSSAGDVNGDGFDDLIIGAYGDDPNGSNSGASFVVFGKMDGTAVELSAVEMGSGGFVINGVSAYDNSGNSVSSAGDVNGDGFDDLIVGAPHDDPNGSGSGASFVVFGKADGAAVELSNVEAGTGGFVINGVSADDLSGSSVSSAGDVNGDGFDDLIVGAYGDAPNGAYSGASFVVFSGDFTGAATQVGTTGADALLGSATDDVIFAGIGDDRLIGNGGNDRLSGGQGDDVFVFDNLGGTTTIIDFEDGLGGQDVLDLTAFGFADGAAVLALASASGPGGHDVLLQLDTDDSILLEEVGLADLDASNFLL